MSFRLEMLQVARVAPKMLGEATELVAAFFRSRQHACGGFLDRDDKPDLYYTVFGIEGLQALRCDLDLPPIRTWLETFANGETLDFVHLCCLARCWAGVGLETLPMVRREAMAAELEKWRSADGGYHVAKGRDVGSAYGGLLGFSFYEDLQLPFPQVERLVDSMQALRLEDGSWANERFLPVGTTPSTAAAASLYRRLGWDPEVRVAQWILGMQHEAGGFIAFKGSPMPDLLSTAVALHGLQGMQANLDSLRELCLDYIDSLWSAAGGFHGNWADNTLDCEYTYYGLLALGHLAV
ncbi:MAG: hypothetical protein KDK97_07465 [Verrucomicrobiales bacterium]|nr:hypothetical protein [Verrucomicrobiales bacterium]MCP5556938.1 hypothetical protein [Verrucomicrobiaceae bacterium]